MRTRSIAIALAAAAAAYAPDARARGGDTGPTLGARLAYGSARGYAEESLPLHDYVSGSVPFVLEAGYRFTKELSAGVYFQYAYARSDGSACLALPPAVRSSGSYCESASGHVLRYGVQGFFRLPLRRVTPWVGLGFGRESVEVDTTAHVPALPGVYEAFNDEVSIGRRTSLAGEANASLGVEWTLKRGLSVGPFVTVTLASYTRAGYSPNPWSLSGGVPSDDRTWHEWLILGVKGTWDL